ncbi:MAG TPA: cell division protein FtsA, partial [Terriglobia bacterium]|nr:cell division protein FtsA [Terriglobia bacterium]
PRAIAHSVLSDILQPRAEEIIHFVRSEIRSAGYERQAGAGVVFVGGGAMLKGFPELAESVLDLPVRIGISTGFAEGKNSQISALQGPEFATVTGLVLYGERRRKTQDFHEGSGSWLKKVLSRLKLFN